MDRFEMWLMQDTKSKLDKKPYYVNVKLGLQTIHSTGKHELSIDAMHEAMAWVAGRDEKEND